MEQTLTQMINDLKKLITNNPDLIELPQHGQKICNHATSNSYEYLVDFTRNGHKVKKFTLQLRDGVNKSQVLIRLDVIGPEHSNPHGNYDYSDKVILTPHIHFADFPDYGVKVAFNLDDPYVKMGLIGDDLDNTKKIVQEFLKKINVANRLSLNIFDPEETSLNV
ncbi:hypothetical protein KIJ05_00490 [Leuconostoc gelidum subsp. gasicomitatum]|uniref:DUF6978 family protein n=1 Tax=Leuconostoc gasicomitatum TaxID=115778 RepID=UPI001CC553DA|nr:hypothetical protein [Leuconostoc gasicomitatum]MBZ5983622.1 hypothetical protein [Leuconostoc gasicomitatum]